MMELKINIAYQDLVALIRQLPAEQLEQLRGELADLKQEPARESISASDIEEGYKAMAEDEEREADAFEWIEGTLNHEEL